ncbi:hypothetical protein ASC94_28605 [Massilia sp. Root418]|uniref:IucA/IucC family protein n=1 Tax=Massilia sp. Root418 TaxID=1736532 RepID=UPI0006F1DA9E|nr:IucA/IucC family protein [Massilia sp. Root418]KQW87350.1 hypothetical protein ASC94_28605 [Massilia sp. Root418]
MQDLIFAAAPPAVRVKRAGASRALRAAVNMREEDSYIRQRVLDTLLREDVRGCVSQATLAGAAQLAGYPGAWARPDGAQWLRLPHFQGGVLWIPVQPARFLQQWRSTAAPLLWQEGMRYTELLVLDDIVACFARGLAPPAQEPFSSLAAECRTAVGHRRIAEAVRERWFGALRLQKLDVHELDWSASLLHYQRVAAFHDHPLHPTARARPGFDRAALEAYGPESQQPFQLRWLALPRGPARADGEGEGWPAAWPTFADVGLPPQLAHSHALVPVHPFLWGTRLDAMLEACGLAGQPAQGAQAVQAPLPWMTVASTLLVRTVALLEAPGWHLELPLTTGTLGTMEPGAASDGCAIQRLLADIAAREPACAQHVLFTSERACGYAAQQGFPGYVLRRYPAAALKGCAVVPVAALGAGTPEGGIVAQALALRYYGGDLPAFFDEYLELTLGLHLRLWLRYGVALESDQQNTLLVLKQRGKRLRLLLESHGTARVRTGHLAQRWPQLAGHVAQLRNPDVAVDQELALARTFIAGTLQLNIAVLAERYAQALKVEPSALHRCVRACVERVLARLEAEGEQVALARRLLLEEDSLYLKRLLLAGGDGAAPNFLRGAGR